MGCARSERRYDARTGSYADLLRYRDMWRRRSHILAPLAAMAPKKAEFKWEQKHQGAFEEIKRAIAREVILAFPDFSKEFHVYTGASGYQLGGAIMQDNKPLAFYSRKLNSAQKNYSVGPKELLGASLGRPGASPTASRSA